MKRWTALLVAASLCLLLGWVFLVQSPQAVAAPQPISTPVPQQLQEEIIQVILDEIQTRIQDQPVFFLTDQRVENVTLSTDTAWASAWLVPQDPQTGQDIATEPGLALLRQVRGEWQVALPGDMNWLFWLQTSPLSLLGAENKAYWLEINAQSEAQVPKAPLGGYFLPWQGGVVGNLTGSLVHDSYIPSCNSHFGFDFTITNPATGRGGLFNIHAAKGGTVWKFRDDLPNGSTTSPGNYMVLQDVTTSPTTYQLYLHLAQGSIPAQLRQVGAVVSQGDFIGVADDTGASSGHHLHFHVHTNPNSYWDRAVDITFDEVDINGGRPRMRFIPGNASWDDFLYCNNWCGYADVCQGYRSQYVSGNNGKTDWILPTGVLTTPANGSKLMERILTISGVAQDAESGLKSIQLFAQYGGAWHEIGPVMTASPFSYEWDLCQAQVPDDLLAIAMRLTDNQFNVAQTSGLVYVNKAFTCVHETPACTPAADEIALYSAPDFGGKCARLGIGSYGTASTLAGLADQVAAIQVGANVAATLFAAENFQGRAETFLQDDSNLGDNLMGTATHSSLQVTPRTFLPTAPRLVWPIFHSIPQADSLSLVWENTGGATEYQARISLPSGNVYTSTWLAEPFWRLGNGVNGNLLEPGYLLWWVRSRNPAGESAWSASLFEVQPAFLPALPTENVPFIDDFDTFTHTWTTTGLWRRSEVPVTPHTGKGYMWFGEDQSGDLRYFTAKSGDLTSPPIQLPPTGSYYLRFWYRYQTESDGIYWDQRWVQISVDGGPFQNIHQSFGEVMLPSNPPENYLNTWLQSPALNLSTYAGHVIRVRFHFDTMDPSGSKSDNDFEGWYIEDVSITADAPPVCSDSHEPNDTPAQAAEISGKSATLNAVICPNGDWDYYKFSGQAGDWIVVDIDAKSIGSSLDSYLYLLDGDGSSILADNDDEKFLVNLDSYLGYRLLRDGVYYLKVRPWSYPKVGGNSYYYTLKFSKDNIPLQARLLNPQDGGAWSPDLQLQAAVTETTSGVKRVEFFWHSADWSNPTWVSLGVGAKSSGLWVLNVSPGVVTEQAGAAFYAQMQDQAGNLAGDVAWNVVVDLTEPVTALNPLDALLNSTAVRLSWTASDNLSGLARFDLQLQVNDGLWQEEATISAPTQQYWFIGQPGATYSFQLRGVDRAGNLEPYPDVAEATTIIPSTQVLCANPDLFEPDNSITEASPLWVGDPPQAHNFCNPQQEQANFQDDEDWIWFDLQAGSSYAILASATAPETAVKLSLIAEDGITLLSEATPLTWGQNTILVWAPAVDMKVYLRARHMNGQVIGSGVSYTLQVYPARQVFLPLAQR